MIQGLQEQKKQFANFLSGKLEDMISEVHVRLVTHVSAPNMLQFNMDNSSKRMLKKSMDCCMSGYDWTILIPKTW
jgi:hypothetical protein